MRDTQLTVPPTEAQPTGAPPAVVVSGLRKSYGDRAVLAGIDLTIDEGEIFALIGPNGAGKSTLVHILSTLIRPDAGTMRIAGFDLVREADGVRGAISLTGQSTAVDGVLTGRENLRMMSRLGGLGRAAATRRTEELLEHFDLTGAADRRVHTYSGGMRRRLDIAISLVTRPRVLFLDEPTTGLDPRSRAAVWEVVRDLAAGGVTILLTTQYLEEADRLADRIAVLDGGTTAARGTAQELKSRVGSARLDVDFRDGAGESYPTDGSPMDLHAALARALSDPREAVTAHVRAPTLDDVFLTLTDRSTAPRGATAKEQSS